MMKSKGKNYYTPTTSIASIVADYPKARSNERDALLDLVKLKPGSTVLDVQAADGYLSDAVSQRLCGNVSCICIEPTQALSQRIARIHTVYDNPTDDMHSIADQSIDTVLGLAGLHHSQSIPRAIQEAYRVLKPGGEYAVCEVEKETAMAHWLNKHVNALNPQGHEGTFLNQGELSLEMEKAGFKMLCEQRKQVPWILDSEDDMIRFFKGVFGLSASLERIRAAIYDCLQIDSRDGKTIVNWHLIYGKGQKPEL